MLQRRILFWLVLLLVGGDVVSVWAQGISCGTTAPISRCEKPVKILAIFARFADVNPPNLPSGAYPWPPTTAVFDINTVNSFTHFLKSISHGTYTPQIDVYPSSAFPGSSMPVGNTRDFYQNNYYSNQDGAFNRDILLAIDPFVNFGNYDASPVDSQVDYIFVIAPRGDNNDVYSPYPGFYISSIPSANGIAHLGDLTPGVSGDLILDGIIINPNRGSGQTGNFGGLTDSHFNRDVAILAHEFFHAITGVGDLYDKEIDSSSEDTANETRSAGVGYWCLMGYAPGWAEPTFIESGPDNISAYVRQKAGWVGGANNDSLVVVSSTMLNQVLRDAEAEGTTKGGKVYKIYASPPDTSEYFLISNRQAIHGFYDTEIPKSGLVIEHVDVRRYENGEEQHKLVDIEEPDGLWMHNGSGRTSLDATSGRDDLDFYTKGTSTAPSYLALYGGNAGAADDVFDGVSYTRFTPYTNPSSNAYGASGSSLTQAQRTGIAVSNIRRSPSDTTVMIADFILNYWSGPITGTVNWGPGTVYVGGDVTVQAGATLNIASGTIVEFTATSDDQGTGTPSKSELYVYGTLNAQGVTFQSANPGTKWGKIVIAGAGSVIKGCTIQDADYGLVVSTTGLTVGGTSIADGNRFSNCTYGVQLNVYGNTVKNNTFTGCTYGIHVSNAANNTISNNLVLGQTGTGILVQGAGTTITNNTLESTMPYAVGIYFQENGSGAVKNTITARHPNGGLWAAAPASVSAEYYLSYLNSTSYELLNIQTSNRKAVFTDPRFIGSGGYRLQSTSPALDLGDPSLPNDPNGSRVDIGRYGGTDSAGVAIGAVLAEDYFNGSAAGWNATAGSWSIDAGQGLYRVSVDGASRSWKAVNASSYTIETRMRFGSSEGKVLFHEADLGEGYRLDLISSDDRARLIAGSSMVWGQPVTIDPNVWYNVRVEVANNTAQVYLNGSPVNSISLGGIQPDGKIGIGSYGYTHTAEFDYVLVLNASGTGGPNYIVNDQFGDGSTGGWTPGSGGWSESGGYFRVVNLDGEGWAYFNSAMGQATFTIKTLMKFGGYEGKVVYHRANVDPGWRVDLMSSDNVRVMTSQGDNNYGRTIDPNTWYTVEVEVNGSTSKLNVWVDGQACNTNVNMPQAPDGRVGVGSYGPPHNTDFDYFQVKSGTRSSKPVVSAGPLIFRLSRNYPNPFNPETVIGYQVPESGHVDLEVYNMIGQRVRTLVDTRQEIGVHEVKWDGLDEAGVVMGSGVYLYRLSVPGYTETRKMTLVR